MSTRKMPLVVSHYTINTGYEHEVKHLVKSLKKFKLDHCIIPIPHQGSWRANSNWCSCAVQKAMKDYPDRDILRVDADAVFVQYPKLFEYSQWDTVDVSAVIHSFPWKPLPRGELLGGTLYFAGNRPHVRWLVDEWVLRCTVTHPTRPNADILRHLVERDFKDKINFQQMPACYCKIFDHMAKVRGGVIVHNQASRRFKRTVNRMPRPK